MTTTSKQQPTKESPRKYRWIVFWVGTDAFGQQYNRITTEETEEDLFAYTDSLNKEIYSLRAKLAQKHNFTLADITNIIERR